MGLLDLLDPLRRALAPALRPCWQSGDRLHLGYREVSPEQFAPFAARVAAALGSLEGVAWAEVNPYTCRIVVSCSPGTQSPDALSRAVAAIEAELGVSGNPFASRASEHPADAWPSLRTAVELGANAVGLGLGLGLRFSPMHPASIGTAAGGFLSLVGAVPRLRRPLDRRIGPRHADHLLTVLTPLAAGLARRHLSPLVDIAYRAALLGEQKARRQAFCRREPDLCKAATGAVLRPPAKPRPLPAGPVEQYAESAWLVSLGAFSVSLLTTRSLRRAAPSLLVGLPKPARLGREVFAAHLGRLLAERGIIPLDPDVLRRLDRVDCLVLEGDLIPRERFLLGAIATSGADAREVRRRARQLFNVDDPLALQSGDGWAIGPLPRLAVRVPEPLAAEARARTASGALVIGVAEGPTLLGVVEVDISPRIGVEELIATARRAKMRVAVVSDDPADIQGFDADDVLPSGAGLAPAIRRLQGEGRVVCVVSRGDSPGLFAADCGVGLCPAGEPPPWGAHLLCGEDLSDARLVLEACLTARQASEQSVRVAVGAAALGGFVSAGGFLPVNARFSLLFVNAASLLSMANGARLSYGLGRRPLPAPRDPTPWHALSAEGALARLGSTRAGLSPREAERRNRPEQAPLPAVIELGQAVLGEVLNPLVPLLAAGAGMSAFVGSLVDAVMVAGVVALNAVLGGVQRFQTERAVRHLGQTERRPVAVMRAGQRGIVDVGELVRGDVVVLHAGDVVPADCRILDASSVEVDASSLTGESLPVTRGVDPCFDGEVAERSSMLYAGTSLAAGRAIAVVVAVGRDTEARRGVASGQQAPARGGLEAKLGALMSLTGPVAAAAGISLVVTGIARGQRLDSIVGSAVSLAVASVPEGLPLLATAAQLSAAGRLSKRGVLVRHPRSIEALGRVDVLCVDKTGTVTEGRVRVACASDGQSEERPGAFGPRTRGVLAAGLRASPDFSDDPHPDAIDAALLDASGAQLAGEVGRDFTRRAELSFEARRGFHAVLSEYAEGLRLSVKGAPEVLLPRCSCWQSPAGLVPLEDAARRALSAEVNRFAARGLRVLAVAEARRDAPATLVDGDVRDLTFLGFLAFSDPVRPSAARAVADLRAAGVEVVMITGDHPSTAEAIAAELDILNARGVLTGADLEQMSDDALRARLSGVRIFARVTPAQKVRVVQALQRSGRVVAMAGDGANDAPAIRVADVGIAMGERSTAAARGAADLVLTEERIETLVDAILEGRAMWGAVRDAVSVLVGGNLGEIGFSLAGGLLKGESPLNARQLLLVNLLTDVGPALAIALRPPRPGGLQAAALSGADAVLGRGMQRDIAVRALGTSAGAGAAWLVGRASGSQSQARTVGMVALVGTQLAQTLVAGGATPAVLLASVGSAALLAAVVQSPLVSRFFGCEPLGPWGWATAAVSTALATCGAVYLLQSQRELEWRAVRAEHRRPLLPRTE